MATSIINQISKKFIELTNKPENFLSVQEDKTNDSIHLLKTLYDFLKDEEAGHSWQPADALQQLITCDFDEEQIWQELELQNEGINDGIVKDVAMLLSKKERLIFDVPSEVKDADDGIDSSEVNNDNFSDDDSNVENEGKDETTEEEESDDDNGSEDNIDEESSNPQKFSSEVDDDFFKLCDMENFCEKIEKDGEKNSIGYDWYGEGEEERELWRYNDFFVKKKGHKDKVEKTVRFEEEQFSDDGANIQEEEFDKNDDAGSLTSEDKAVNEDENGKKSNFEARQERLKSRIESLEEAALAEKPWFLRGEITSSGRPQNSLLQEYVEFDRAVRPAPVFTEKTTLRLEDIIKQRMKDKSWDDVVRKMKPVEDVREYRKRLVLDQEKSKVSLAQIYEQEYIKQRDAASAAAANADQAPSEQAEPAEHIEIRSMMNKLFSKLDALSNFHYTPKPVAPEIKIINNMPAITMEEVAPISTSDAALLAPEEIKNKPKGELMSKDERTETDKNRERRKKKTLQRVRQKEKEKKDKLLNKMSLGLGNKYSKEKAKKTLDKLSKEGNVDKMIVSQSKHLRSSSAFFNQLENDVRAQVNSKGDKKRKKTVDAVTAKKMKL